MSNIQEYTDENYLVKVETLPECIVKIDVTVKPAITEKMYNEAIKKVSKHYSVPGFRRGKAPKEIILKNCAPQVDEEWQKSLVNDALRKGMLLSNLYPFGRDSVEKAQVKMVSRTEDSLFHFQFESMPSVPEVNLQELHIEKVLPGPVSDTQIDQVIEDILYQSAEWETITDRPVQEGDFVDVDIENMDAPGEFLCEDTRLEVAKGKIGTWLINLLVGMNVGESREETSAQEEGMENPEFVPTKCRVTVKEILKSILPVFDDELAKKAGFDSAELMREKIVKDLERIAEVEAKNKMREALKDKILANYTFDLPYSVYKEYYKNLLDSREEELRSSNEAFTEEKKAELQETVRKEVFDVYRWEYLIKKVLEDKNIDVTHEQVVGEILSNKQFLQHLHDEEQSKRIYQHVYLSLLNKKALDSLLETLE